MELTGINGKAMIDVLPDSGADISVIGLDVLHKLGDHEYNLGKHGMVTSTAVNGAIMKPLGTTEVTFRLGPYETEEIVHVYRGVHGALMSWSAAKRIGILPESYPNHKVTLRESRQLSLDRTLCSTIDMGLCTVC